LKPVLLSACIAALSISTAAAAASPGVGTYNGKASPAAPAKPHSISFKVTKGTCSPPNGRTNANAYCATFSTTSFVQALCSESGFYYDAFFPIAAPMALSPRGKINAVLPLYVAGGGAYGVPGPGRTKAGTFELTLVVSGQSATGMEHFKANLGGGDGVCDSGVVTISARHG
jgi:hypothetical protein